MKKIIVVIILIFIVLSNFAQTQKYSKVKIYCDDKNLYKLESLGIPLEGQYKKDSYFITEISENDIAKLLTSGFKYEILIDDVTAFYIDRNEHPENYKVETAVKSGNCVSAGNWPTPSHFILGFYGRFLYICRNACATRQYEGLLSKSYQCKTKGRHDGQY